MADELTLSLLDLLRKMDTEGRTDFLRTSVERLMQAIIEAEVEQVIGAGRYERSEERSNQRNGSRERPLDTQVGSVTLQIPKLRKGSFFPALLERRRRVDQTLVNVVSEAYVQGVSTRKVDDLVRALGVDGMDKSTVSRLAATLDEDVRAFRDRPLTAAYPYVWVDATFPHVREGSRVVSMALMVAIGVDEEGRRSILGLSLESSESTATWTDFLRSLVDRGLRGVQLVISDDHQGLKAAVRQVMAGASWQRCAVHFTRNVMAQVPKHAQPSVKGMVSQIFDQPDADSAKRQLRQTVDSLVKKYAKAASVVARAEEEVLAHMAFPREHWRNIRNTNGLERLNREIGRRLDVVGIFPNRESVIRLAGAVLSDQEDEWATSPRRYFAQESMQVLVSDVGGEGYPEGEEVSDPAVGQAC